MDKPAPATPPSNGPPKEPAHRPVDGRSASGGPASKTPALRIRGPAAAVLYLAQAAVHLLAVILAAIPQGPDPVASALAWALASMAAATIHWLAFNRLNPRLVGLELIGLILITYYHPRLSHYAVLWVAAGALAGGAGAWLSQRPTREEDFLFQPPATAVGSYAFLIWLAEGCRISEPARVGWRWLTAFYDTCAEGVRELIASGQFGFLYTERDVRVQLWLVMLLPLLIWLSGLWMAGRMARHWSGRFDPQRAALLLFRIDRRYIFLLICGLGLWIVGILTGREQYAAVAAVPVVMLFAIACFLEGLAVILYHLALMRATSSPVAHRLMMILLLIAALLLTLYFVPICAALGLADIWFDFRRVKAVEKRLGTDR
jgi:hypothetical protein